jgi:5,5'-dehydrodivanillate O-demethylase oxygenase subunit
MLSKEDNATLTQVGPGTPGGKLMRMYWQPIAAVKELDDSQFRTKEITILGEELVLYRDRQGNLGLVERYCSHRRVNLAIGVVEDDGIRCQYHGWKFDATGKCIEQPFEDTMHPEAAFRAKCGIAGYPVREMAGLVFAYLGPTPAPEFPMWEPYAWNNVVRDIAIIELDCNWLQCQENSLDPVHNEWLHGYYGNYVRNLMNLDANRGQGNRSTKKHLKIGFDAFEYGIVNRRIQEGGSEEDDDWKVGHPVMFPNILLVGSQFSATMQFRVPVDDTKTLHISLYSFRAAPGAKAPHQESVPYRYVNLHQGNGNWILNYIFNQDYSAWVTQGPVAKRHLEKLGESDRGIIMFRQQLKDQIAVVEAGNDPMCVFREPEQAQFVELPLEKDKFGANRRPPKYVPGEEGYSADAKLIEQTLATWDALPEHAAVPVTASPAPAPVR